MPKGMLFWVIFILVILSMLAPLLFDGGRWFSIGGSVAELILIGLLGWQVFGKPVQ